MDIESTKAARSALRAETDRGLKALQTGDRDEALRHLALGAYYLGHLHSLDPSLQAHVLGTEPYTDPDDARFHAFMHRLLR